jgi:uncharacterized protein YgbK (DUF1537 family)
MAEYTEYKYATSGLRKLKASDVLHVGLDTIRAGGPDSVKQRLMEAENQRIITVDLVTPRDLQVIVLGLLMAEGEGKNYLYRSAASLAAARVNMHDIPVLSRRDILGPNVRKLAGNILCLWGSIVELSNQQLEAVLKQTPDTSSIEFNVRTILSGDDEREETVVSAVMGVEDAFAQGRNAVVYTYPRTVYPAEELAVDVRAANEQKIASALQEVYNRLTTQPGAVIFKGGTTSSIGLLSSGTRKVYALGQIDSGIPIMKILPEDNTRFPGRETLVILGPGNVGVADTYVDMMKKLLGN